MSKNTEHTNIHRVIIFDGDKEFEAEEILDNADFIRYYNTANVMYKFFIDDINNSDAYLYIDASDRPTFQIKNASIKLLEKLRAANLG